MTKRSERRNATAANAEDAKEPRKLSTTFLLLAMYDGRTCVSAEEVARDFFSLGRDQFVRKVDRGEIDLPLIRIESSAKAARLVHVNDLAAYIDRRREEAEATLARTLASRDTT